MRRSTGNKERVDGSKELSNPFISPQYKPTQINHVLAL